MIDFRNADFSPLVSQLYYFTVQRATDAVFWLTNDGVIRHANEAACQRLEYTYEELVGMNILQINREVRAIDMEKLFAANKEKGNQVFESFHYTKSGKAIPVEIAMNFIELNGEEYSCSIVRDVTERHQKEAALRGAFREIQELKDRLEAENAYLQAEIRSDHNFDEIVTQSEQFRSVLSQVAQVADTGATVLISGESGTGKELIARALHKLSRRSTRPIIKVNCAALPSHLIESELFGHERGAFTGAVSQKKGRFELSDGGTLFLDEIGEMPIELQPKLLRALQEGEFERLGGTKTVKVDVRIIAATNRNLLQEVKAGTFREDLYYRLNVFPVQIPPLRARKEDIPLLVQHFIKKFENRIGKQITRIPQDTIRELQGYHFPGNVRELENLVERAVIVAQHGILRMGDWLPQGKVEQKKEDVFANLEEVQRFHIEQVLQHTNWRISGPKGAALILGLKPTTLEARMKKLGIRRSNATE